MDRRVRVFLHLIAILFVYKFLITETDARSERVTTNDQIVVQKKTRIVAIGDIHGDLPNMKKVLKIAKLIDDEFNWIAGETIFVQTVFCPGNDRSLIFVGRHCRQRS